MLPKPKFAELVKTTRIDLEPRNSNSQYTFFHPVNRKPDKTKQTQVRQHPGHLILYFLPSFLPSFTCTTSFPPRSFALFLYSTLPTYSSFFHLPLNFHCQSCLFCHHPSLSLLFQGYPLPCSRLRRRVKERSWPTCI